NHMPRQLSGGEQQRVAIARALVMKPKYLFADEPTGNLDTANGEMVMSLLNRAVSEFKTAIVMVTHDTGFASRAHRQIVLSDGEIVHQGHRE
ncbi:MAG TPA: ATP-binding cassette domain-containing protein, partial [Pseudobdellovibrionaceae bacterium]|nr:ATP-binding cassette domain-containing protein [Pseudobdellovibrionaceae bacterium]